MNTLMIFSSLAEPDCYIASFFHCDVIYLVGKIGSAEVPLSSSNHRKVFQLIAKAVAVKKLLRK